VAPATGRHAEAAVAADVEDYGGPDTAQAGHEVGQVVVGPQGGMNVAGPQGQHDELVVVGAGDDQRQVLVLIVVAVPEGQLLVPVGRVIHGVEVERQVAGRGVEGGDELVNEDVTESLEGLDRNGVLEAG
jgi:hypothetical protein